MKKLLKTALMLVCHVYILSYGISQNYVSMAETLINKGQYSEALLNLNKQIASNPNDVKAFMMLADVQMRLGKVELACATYSAIENLGKHDDNFYYAYGTALKMHGKYDQAIEKFGKCTSSHKDKAKKQIESCVYAKDLIKSAEVKKVLKMDFNSEYDEFGLTMYQNMIVYNSSKMPFMTDATKSLLGSKPMNYACKTLMNGTASAIFVEGENATQNVEAMMINESNLMVYSVVEKPTLNFQSRIENSKLLFCEYNGYNFENVEYFNHNHDNFSNYSACLSPDGNTVYFASNRPGGFGGFDLYKSEYNGKTWNAPVNLGNNINTEGNEITPFYFNGMLWFASDAHKGLGGYDIFSSQNMNDKFSTPENMGVGINTSANDYFPMVKNLVMYLSSDRDGVNQNDIFRVPLTENHLTMNLISPEANTTLIALNEDKLEEETPPPAVALFDEAYNAKSIDVSMLESARRVSLKEATNNKPNVYFIQLASVSNPTSIIADKYKGLLRFGNIYRMEVNNISKIRLGYFLDRSETDRLLVKVRNSGFKDAFIVEQDLSMANLELVLSQNESVNLTQTNKVPTSSSKISTNNANSKKYNNIPLGNFEHTKPIENTYREYKVRLGAFEDPIWFDSKKAKDLGKIEQWTKGDWTIFILSGFANFEEADQAKIQAINRGYVDAEVVIDNGGIIERIKKN